MRRPPPPHRRGEPKTPGSGRRRGSLNRKTLELRELMAALVGNVDYQQKLREAWVKRRIHPTTEALIWAYAIGRPKDQIDMSAQVSMDDGLAAEREMFTRLSVEELEALAAESQVLVDRAVSMARAHGVTVDAATARRAPVAHGDGRDTSDPKGTGTRVARSNDEGSALDQGSAKTSALTIGVSPSPAAAVEDIVTDEQSTDPTVG
jgi:hypothetical protein